MNIQEISISLQLLPALVSFFKPESVISKGIQDTDADTETLVSYLNCQNLFQIGFEENPSSFELNKTKPYFYLPTYDTLLVDINSKENVYIFPENKLAYNILHDAPLRLDSNVYTYKANITKGISQKFHVFYLSKLLS